MKTYIERLSNLPLFDEIDTADIPNMLKCLRVQERHFAKDTYVCNEGDPADFIGIVLNGSIHVLQDDYSGKRTVNAAFGPGDIFAEAVALAEIPALPFSILSVTDTDLLFIDVEHLLHQCNHVCEFHSRLIENLLKIVARKNLFLNQKLHCVTRKTTGEKLLAYLNEQARKQHSDEFLIPFDRQGLADYLGVERSAMSAGLSRLQKRGIL